MIRKSKVVAKTLFWICLGHITSNPFFLKYKILKINDLVDFNQAIFMYKYTHKLLPASFENIFKKLGNFELST